jgi:DNA-binding beta-propeller fold protein YncE
MRVELLALQRKLGITTIFVTHDQEEALSIADRVAVLDAGVIQQVGTPTELARHPRNAFVAKFMGDNNVLHGKIASSSGKNVIIDTPHGKVEVAGTGKAGDSPDGAPVKGTPIKGPRSIDFDAAGNLWVCTREGNQVLKLDLKADKISLIAGTGKKGFTGNGGPAKLATLSGPKGVAFDAAGNAWIADTESHSIRMVDAKTGKLELMMGTGVKGDGPDGDPLKCGLARPHGIWVDPDGSVFVGDSENHRLRVLKP